MAYASFHQDPNAPVRERDITEGGLSQGKAIAKIYGYMGIGLIITAVVSFFASWLFSAEINKWLAAGIDKVDLANGWIIALFATWIISFIAILVLSFVIPVRAARDGKSLWVPYILYAVFMGLLLTAVLLSGIEFWMIGEAFGITSLAFVGVFCIGWFSKKDLSILAFIAMILLFGIMMAALVALITFLVRGMTADQLYWFDVGISAAMIGVILLITIVDTWRIKRLIAHAGESTNMYLYGAYVMYCDFIALLLRVLLIIAKTQRK